MKITKLGHCCLIVEENGVRIMTDPRRSAKISYSPRHEFVDILEGATREF